MKVGKTLKFQLIFSFTVAILGLFAWWLYVEISRLNAKSYYESVKDNLKVYGYDTTTGVLRPIIFIKSLSKQAELIHYYDSTLAWNIGVSEGRIKPRMWISKDGNDTFMAEPVLISFTPQYFSCTRQLILLGYVDPDSLLAEVVDFNTKCWGYIQGYVYTKTLHQNPASKKMIDAYNKYWNEKYQSEQNQQSLRISGNHSPYGIQCE